MNTTSAVKLVKMLTLAAVTPLGAQAAGPVGEYPFLYGVDTARPADFALLRALGANLVQVPLPANDTEGLQAVLNAAERHDLQVILWPVGGGLESLPWRLTPDGWDLSQGERMLAECEAYVRGGGQHLLGVVNMHEPFWLGGDPLTSSQLADLYDAIKQQAPQVSQVCYINALAVFEHKGPETRIVDGLCDWAIIWRHCFGGAEGSEAQALARIDEDAALIADKGLRMKLIFSAQSFGMDGTRYRMPSADEMASFGQEALAKQKLDGFLWYSWGNPAAYDQCLRTHRYDDRGADRWAVLETLARRFSPVFVDE